MAVRQIAGQPTVALPALTQLHINGFIGQNYDRFLAFERAIKVFQKCFLHYQSWNNAIYVQMFDEFMDQMVDLYDVGTDPRLLNFNTATIDQNVTNELKGLSVGVTELKSTEVLISARMTVQLGYTPHQPIVWIANVNQREQNGLSFNITLVHNDLVDACDYSEQIELNYSDAIVANDWRDYPVFTLPWQNLHHEGFRQWIEFGNTRVLFCIEFNINVVNYDERTASLFHINTILLAIQRRLTHLRAQPPDQQFYRHDSPLMERRVSHEIGIVDPTEREAFWGTTPDRAQNHLNFGRVKYMDFQIGYRFGQKVVSPKYCTCNEFCNMNAFFHYNPIYRFLLVEHNRHYVRNKTIVANWYEAALTHLATPTVPIQLTPVFELLNSVSERVTANHLILISIPNLWNRWRTARPSGLDLEGVVYKYLTNINLADAMAVIYGQVQFDENAFVIIQKLMERQYEMHRRIEKYARFVDNNRVTRKQWVIEFENRSLNHYCAFMVFSLISALAAHNQTFDERLFTPDYELKAHHSSSAKREQLIRWGRIEHRNYQFNVLFELNCFSFAFNQIWMSLTRFEPLHLISAPEALRSQYSSLKGMADVMDLQLSSPNLIGNTRIRLSPASVQRLQDYGITQNGMQSFQQFYKLKLYSRLYRIHHKFLDSLLKHTAKSGLTELQAFNVFPVIYKTLWIEDIFSPTPLVNLFTVNNDFMNLVRDFYVTFWGQPAHHTMGQNINWTTIRLSIFQEYAKRRFWDRINGENRELFQNIFQSIEDSLNLLVDQCHTVYQDHIMVSMEEVRTCFENQETTLEEDDKNYCLVLDVLVYWMIRAVFHQMSVIVASILKSIDGLHLPNLVQHNIQYFLSKPGLVQFFQTKARVLRRVDEIHNQFIAFSNPFDNIGEVVRQTKYDIKMLYKEYFRKLVDNWLRQFHLFIVQHHPQFNPMVKLHLISGTAFVMSSINENRRTVCFIRKTLNKRRNTNLIGVSTFIPFTRIWDLCLDWFTNLNPNELSRPFILNRWQTNLVNEYTRMDAMDFSQLQAGAGAIVQPIP